MCVTREGGREIFVLCSLIAAMRVKAWCVCMHRHTSISCIRTYVYVRMYVYIDASIHMYIYIYREREGERVTRVAAVCSVGRKTWA